MDDDFKMRMQGFLDQLDRLAETLAALRQLATRDQLTGMLNRREFDRILAEEEERSRRFGHPFSLVMMDIDHFKKVNDQYGHQAGDAVLRHLADILLHSFRELDVVARVGGEEFVVLLPGARGSSEAGPSSLGRRQTCPVLAISTMP